MPVTTNFDEFAKKYHDNCQSAPFDKPINIGETESMDMIEILNQEFDVVANENEQLKKEIEQLKGTINCRDYQLDKCKNHYSEVASFVRCKSCKSEIEYDDEFVHCATTSARGGTLCQRICQDCIDDGELQDNKWQRLSRIDGSPWIFTFMNGSSEVDDA